MNINKLVDLLGEDIDLLTRSDEWLEEQRKSVAAELDSIGKELQSIIYAQLIKKHLQQKNYVALQTLIKDEKGEIADIGIELVSLPDAINKLKNDVKIPLDMINASAQLAGWVSDGYDIETSEKLR